MGMVCAPPWWASQKGGNIFFEAPRHRQQLSNSCAPSSPNIRSTKSRLFPNTRADYIYLLLCPKCRSVAKLPRLSSSKKVVAPPRPVPSSGKLWLTVYDAGTDSSQGKGQIISNINACLAVQATIKSTLGPYGGDLLMVDANGRQTITNDGATVMKVGKSSCEYEFCGMARFLTSIAT
jgi:hypothetical protein